MRVLLLKKSFLSIILALGVSIPILAHSNDNDLGNWLIYIGNKKLNQSWNIHNEIQYRNYNAIGDLEQLLLRTGIGHTLADKQTNILIGYGYILSKNYIDISEKASVKEHRIFQQFTTKQKIGLLNLNHRYRFEQRFIEDDYKMRFRYFLGLNLPLIKRKDNSSKFYASAYNELFINTESSVFDRNRLFGGLGYSVKKNIRFELGYMNQFFESDNRDQLNIITYLSF